MKLNTYEFFSAGALGGVVDVAKSADATKSLKNIGSLTDLSKINLPKIDLPKIDLPKIDLPKIDLPKIDLPKIDLPKIDLPKIDVPDIGKGVDKSFLSKASDIIKQGGSDAAEFVTKHPKLATAGLAVSSIGIYAAVNGLSFGQAVGKLENMAASEVAEVIKATGSAATELISEGVAPAVTGVAGAAGGAIGGAAGNLIGSTLDGVLNPLAKSLGIPKSQLLYIIAGIVIFFVLIWLYRMFASSSNDDYNIKYFSFGGGFGDVNLHNLEYLGKSMN